MLCFAMLRGFRVDAEPTILFVESTVSTSRIKSLQNLYCFTFSLRCGSLAVCNDACQEDCAAASLYAVRQTTKTIFLFLSTVNVKPLAENA
jgi:hypothetical protein